MRVKTEFQIYEKTHRSGRMSWVVSLGMVNGKRKFHPCATREEAQLFKAKCEEKNALKHPVALSDLSELGRASIRHALVKLKPFDATITEAVDFFVRFAKPPKGKITIQEAMDFFAADKEAEGLSMTYVKNSKRCFFAPFRDAFKNRLMNDVTATEAHKYIYGRDSWNKTTKNSHNRHLRALYSFVIGKRHATMNPFLSVPFVKDKGSKVKGKILTVENVQTLLDTALATGRKRECACLALVLFCGVRVDEVERVSWEAVKLEGSKPHVDIEDTKNGKRRINYLSENAVLWLQQCKGKGRIAPDNYTKAMQRFRKSAKIPYPQNAARHSFASYHIAMHEDGLKTAFMLGHPNAALLYSTYNETVRKEDAQRYWSIIPATVASEREAALKLFKEAAKADAEALSNCGQAWEDEGGNWQPVIEEDADS